MAGSRESDQYQIIWLVRRLFRALAQKSSEHLEGFGVSVADRAVMEFLYPDATLSVPAIAARYKVSRQHVQVTVNSLLDKGLVVARDNPRHKRSPLVALTARGRRLFTTILAKDGEAVDLLFSRIPVADTRTTRHTLQTLLDTLDGGDSHA